MSEATKVIEIDELLEQVALAMAKGDNQTATHLLPKIIATGDEVQRQMAQSYLVQLDALIAMEEEEAKLSEFIDFNENSDENSEENDLVSDADVDSQSAIALEGEGQVTEAISLIEKEAITDIDSVGGDEIIELGEVDAFDNVDAFDEVHHVSPDSLDTTLETMGTPSLKEELPETPVAAKSQPMQTFDTADVASHKDFDSSDAQYGVEHADENISMTDVDVIEGVDKHTVSEPFIIETDSVTDAAETIQESTVAKTDEIAVASHGDAVDIPATDVADGKAPEEVTPLMYQELSAQEEQAKEYDIALEQAAMLIDDGEYGTAEMLLEAVFEGGGGTQLQMAEAYKMQIQQLSQMPEAETSSAEIVSEQSQAVTEPEPLLDVMPEELSNAPVELIDFIDEPIGVSTADDLFDVDNIFNDKPTVAKPATGSLENRAFRTQYGNTDNTISTVTGTSEQFYEKENTEGLLAPTAALGAFTFSGDDLLPKGSTAITDEVVNQRQGFFVGDVGLMIDFIGGSELTEMPDYYAVPNAPLWLKGLTNLHGVIVPVFDLVQFLNLEQKSDGKQMLLILQHHEKAVGVVVNGLPTRLSWRDSQRMENNASPDSLSHYIDGAYLLNEQLWFDLDVDSLCAALERGLASAA